MDIQSFLNIIRTVRGLGADKCLVKRARSQRHLWLFVGNLHKHLTDRGGGIPAKSLAADLLLLRPRAITAVRLSLCGVGWQIIFRVCMMCTVVPFPVLTGPRRMLNA
jgi:hypothetical protein